MTSIPRTPSAAADRINRRQARAWAALLHAGRALLAQPDVDALSVDEIVADADVTKGSFYNHFSDKDVFARERSRAVRRQAEEEANATNRGVNDPAERLARALCVLVGFAISHRDSSQVLWRLNSDATIADAPVNRGLREEVARARLCPEFKDLDIESRVLLIMGTFVIPMRHVLRERAVTPAATVASRMDEVLLRGLGLPLKRARSVATRATADLLPPTGTWRAATHQD